MIGSANEELREVLVRVSNWPAGDRIILARKILETVEAQPPAGKRGYSAEEVIALLNMPQPAPDDAECQKILDEERMKKYGQ